MYSGAEEVVFLKFIKEIQQFSHVLGSTWAVWPGIIFFFLRNVWAGTIALGKAEAPRTRWGPGCLSRLGFLVGTAGCPNARPPGGAADQQ